MYRVISMALFLIISLPSRAQDVCQIIAGSSVIADDGTFLGELSNPYAPDSIFNEFGDYGSEYSSTSIWNQYGSYGGKYSPQSPFNRYSSSPPVLVKRGKAIAYLSVNNALDPALNPYSLKSCEFY